MRCRPPLGSLLALVAALAASVSARADQLEQDTASDAGITATLHDLFHR